MSANPRFFSNDFVVAVLDGSQDKIQQRALAERKKQLELIDIRSESLGLSEATRSRAAELQNKAKKAS